MTQSTAFKTEWDKLFIGGKWVEPSTSEMIEVHSPATGELVGKVPMAAKADVDAACAAARKAFDEGPWPHMSPEERAAVLGGAVKIMEERADELKFLLAAETGQPPTIVDMMQYGAAMSAFQFYAGAADKFTWRDIRDGIYGQTLVIREPIGVVGAVTAWNVPFFLAANKLGPALLAGCTLVLKPAAETPLSVFAMAEMFAEAGLPEGVLSIVPGGPETGEGRMVPSSVRQVPRLLPGSPGVAYSSVKERAGRPDAKVRSECSRWVRISPAALIARSPRSSQQNSTRFDAARPVAGCAA